ncbi:MAG TPA: lipoyl(octanoyl) transferase LipB [Candidatus Acidoferrum sp.]|jgi:lipoate-protein ligase B|nr:lipoyl(octanoyl) transferase LipB [Candidatus Acidoferrum sp.]
MAVNARLLDLGQRPYREVWELQHSLHDAVRQGREPDTWILVEHEPVITLGRQAKRDNVLLAPDLLAARGVDVVEIERGGDVTYHGPGQLVVYPIRRLERFREIVPLVRSLEGAVIEAVAHFGIAAERWKEHAGVWAGRNQICAIGLAVQKMVSLHGIALNVSTALDYDRLINPCGLTDRGITSISHEIGRTVTIDEVKPVLIAALEKEFGMTFVWPLKSI